MPDVHQLQHGVPMETKPTAASTRRRAFHRYRRVILVGLAIFSAVGADFVLAAVYRVTCGYSFHYPGVPRDCRTKHKIFDHGLRPNSHSDAVRWGARVYTLATDSLGFRSKSVQETPLESDRYRMLFIGDSFTEGIGVEFEDSFVGRIAKQLESNGVEVLNAAVVSYAPTVYRRKVQYFLENVGLRIDELVVCIDISDIEDEDRFYRLTPEDTVYRLGEILHHPAPSGLKAVSRFFRENTIVTFATLQGLRNVFLGYQYGIDRRRARWTSDSSLYEAYGKDGLDRSTQQMNVLADLLSKHDVKLTVVVYPWPDQIVDRELNCRQVSHWKQWCDERGARFCDLFPSFISKDASDEELRNDIRRYFISGDVHWNEDGHERVADEFLRLTTGD